MNSCGEACWCWRDETWVTAAAALYVTALSAKPAFNTQGQTCLIHSDSFWGGRTVVIKYRDSKSLRVFWMCSCTRWGDWEFLYDGQSTPLVGSTVEKLNNPFFTHTHPSQSRQMVTGPEPDSPGDAVPLKETSPHCCYLVFKQGGFARFFSITLTVMMVIWSPSSQV